MRYNGLANELPLASKKTRGLKIPKEKLLDEYTKTLETRHHDYHMSKYYEQLEPMIVEFVSVLGIDRIRSYSFRWKNIVDLYNKEIDLLRLDEDKESVREYLNLHVGQFYTYKYLKEELIKLYKDYNVSAAPKATEITRWWECKKTNKRGENGFLILSTL